MLDRQCLAVHRVREQDAGVARVIELEAALEGRWAVAASDFARVGAPKHDLLPARLNAGPIKDFDQRHARPLGRAHGAPLPLLAFHRRVELGPAIASAFERDHFGVRRQPLEISQAQAHRPLHQAIHAQPPGVRREQRDLEVVAHIEVGVRHYDASDEGRNRGLAIQRMGSMDDQAGVDRPLARFLCIQRRHTLDRRQLEPAATARHDTDAG